MSDFDSKAKEWDANPEHWERSKAVADFLKDMIPLKKEMKALEFGAGTGILSFMLSDCFSEILLMDSSQEMIKVIHDKINKANVKNLIPIYYDLEHSDYTSQKFDCLYNQMVLHHIVNIEAIFFKFYTMLNKGGYLAIADLYTENGTFHGKDFNGHQGFDVNELERILTRIGFKNIKHLQCFALKKEIEDGTIKEFPVFLLTAVK